MAKIKKDIKTKSQPEESGNIVVAKSEDGSVQITFTIAAEDINKSKDVALEELGVAMEIPGFRKGKAPKDKIEEKVSKDQLYQKTLEKIIPRLLAQAITEHKLNLAIYPKYELISAEENKDWQVRALTCELPELDLGNYKQTLATALKANKIWVPGKKDNDTKPNSEEREQLILKTLTEVVNVTIPKILIDEEVNQRLIKLLERIEKLGLSLESYLSSLGKTIESLRKEYQEQSTKAIQLELILTKIAEEEKLSVDISDVEKALQASASDTPTKDKITEPEQRRIIEMILKRRKALDYLNSLAN